MLLRTYRKFHLSVINPTNVMCVTVELDWVHKYLIDINKSLLRDKYS